MHRSFRPSVFIFKCFLKIISVFIPLKLITTKTSVNLKEDFMFFDITAYKKILSVNLIKV